MLGASLAYEVSHVIMFSDLHLDEKASHLDVEDKDQLTESLG